MKKSSLAVLLMTAALVVSLCVPCFADTTKSFASADIMSEQGAISGGGGLTLQTGAYAGFSGVNLDGIRSVSVKATCNMPYGSAGTTLRVHIDDPYSGALLGYVVIGDDEKTVFTGNIKETSGSHTVYFTSAYGDNQYVILDSATFSSAAAETPGAPVPDSAIVDNYHDTWQATDDLGRRVADYAEAGDVKTGEHAVGIMYWDWHETKSEPQIVAQEVIREFPEAKNDYTHPAWTVENCYWGKPILGFYDSTDYWVYRRHCQWLANAGVDAIFFDYTNQGHIFQKHLKTLLRAFQDARATGINSPKVSAYFGGPQHADLGLESLWFNYLGDDRYSDLYFIWDGKPLVVAQPKGSMLSYVDKTDKTRLAIIDEIYANITVRGLGSRENGQQAGDPPSFIWLENYPLHEWGASRGDGRVEAMTVGCSINHSYVYGYGATGCASDEYTKGRGYSEAFGEDYSANNARSGIFFREQSAQVLDTNPAFVYIDGWNEFTATRQQKYAGLTNAFVDTFDDENSRDIEPVDGALKDDYYLMMTDFIRKYKGVRPAPVASEKVTIDIGGDLAVWDSVLPRFINDDDSLERNSVGKGGVTYQTSVPNSIAEAKVARDDANVYFYVKARKDIKTGTNEFLHLYIDTDRNHATGWEGYDFAYNRTPGKLEAYNGAWQAIADVSSVVNGDTMVLSVPKATLGIETMNFEFKWVDGAGEVASGNIMDVYKNGSAAPMGRFNYLYTEIPETTLSATDRANLFETTVFKANSARMISEGSETYVYEKDNRVTTFVGSDGMLYVPVDAVYEMMYGESKVEYDAGDNVLYVKGFALVDREITDYRWTYTTIGSREARVNGEVVALSAATTVINGIIYIPVSYIAECFGWDLVDEDGVYVLARGQKADLTLGRRVAENLE